MKPFQSNFRSTAAINVNLLAATGCGFSAWAVWPSSVEWWGFGVVSILLGGAAIAAAVKAGSAMIALRAKDRAVADYLAQGARQKSARLVSDRELEEKGLLG
jgi:hypothetical protein